MLLILCKRPSSFTQLIKFHYPNRSASIPISQNDILKIIQSLDPNKSHGPHKTIVCMIMTPLKIMIKSSITNGEFPSEWKKANIVPVHKGND